MNIFVETNRFILREIVEEDVQGMFELDSDPEVHRFLGNNPIKSIQEAEQVIEYIRNQYKENGIGRWAVIEKGSNEFVGWSGLKLEKVIRPDRAYYDLGYRFRRKFWGQGIATETAIASLEYGFTKMNLKEICAAADVDHVASNKVLQKAGLNLIEVFHFENIPHNWYQLSNSEWKQKNSLI